MRRRSGSSSSTSRRIARRKRSSSISGSTAAAGSIRNCSASDAEMFPAGFKALGLGKVVGVPTMGAVIGTGAYTLLDGSSIRTPASGVWTVTSQNMENYGVPPDVFVDNTPADFLKGRDAQIEKAVEVLKADLAGKKASTAQP
jgi:C-terminal processing protease CtpA/Prc